MGVNWHDYIERLPGVMLGKPVFRGTRITVELVLERLASGATTDDLIANYPPLTREHISAALAYALAVVKDEDVLLSV